MVLRMPLVKGKHGDGNRELDGIVTYALYGIDAIGLGFRSAALWADRNA